MSAVCPHGAQNGRSSVPDRLSFTDAYPGQCDCDIAQHVVHRHREWFHTIQSNIGNSWAAYQLSTYFAALYEDPTVTTDNVDAALLSFFWSSAPNVTNLGAVWWACLHCYFPTDVLWAPWQDATLDPCTSPVAAPFPGFFVQSRFAVEVQLVGIPDDHWVEIFRIARINDKPDAVDQSTRGTVWMWLAVGSGIWWNVGRSKRFLATDGRFVANHSTCEEIRRDGYDSIQLTEFYPSMALELIDCRGALLESASETWERACPPAHVELRAGVPPEPRYAPALSKLPNGSAWSRRCECDPALAHVDCLPAPPPSPLTPPLAPLAAPPPSDLPFLPPLTPPPSPDLGPLAAVGVLLGVCTLISLLTTALCLHKRGSLVTAATSQRSSAEGAQPTSRRKARGKFGRLDEAEADEQGPTSSGNDERPAAGIRISAMPLVSWRVAVCASVIAGAAASTAVLLIVVHVSTPPLAALPSPSPPSAPPLPPAAPVPDPATPPPAPLHPSVGYVGGCRSPWPRASYSARTGCNETASACATCSASTVSCDQVTMASGMQFPRHNVQQFQGNAIWDGPTLDLGSAVAAMLGDPFEFAVSPEMDALRHVLAGRSHAEMLRALEQRWYDEDRYPAYEMSRWTRNAFLGAISGLTADYVLGHTSWPSLVPDAGMRERIEAVVRARRANQSFSDAAATCAALVVMDGLFAQKSTTDLWVTSLLAAGAGSRNGEADPHTLFRQLYVEDAGGDTTVEVDPSSEIYSTAYQTNANGFYGGNLTFVYKASDEGGSGIDTVYVSRMVCPGPPPIGQSVAAWHTDWCAAREEGALEFARSSGDAGELRTPNYKAPHEIDGVQLFAWPPRPSSWNPANSFDFDLSTLMRPLQWAFYRNDVPGPQQVLILCPAAAARSVYGIIDRGAQQQPARVPRFVASASPPESLGGPRADDSIAPGVPYSTLDRARAQEPTLAVPVWGMLFRCALGNLQRLAEERSARDAAPSLTDTLFAPADVHRLCEAAAALRAHEVQDESATTAESEAVAALETTALPFEVREALARPIWPSRATVDLSVSPEVLSEEPTDAICVLSRADLRAEEQRLREACGEP